MYVPVGRSHAGIVVERAEADAGGLVGTRCDRPQGRAAGRAECLAEAVGWLPDANEICTRQHAHRARHDSRLGRRAAAGAPLAARAVAVRGRDRLLGHLEAHPAAEAAAAERERVSGRMRHRGQHSPAKADCRFGCLRVRVRATAPEEARRREQGETRAWDDDALRSLPLRWQRWAPRQPGRRCLGLVRARATGRVFFPNPGGRGRRSAC